MRASENVALMIGVFVFTTAPSAGTKSEITGAFLSITKVDDSVIFFESIVYPITSTVPLPSRVVEFMVAVYVYSLSEIVGELRLILFDERSSTVTDGLFLSATDVITLIVSVPVLVGSGVVRIVKSLSVVSTSIVSKAVPLL